MKQNNLNLTVYFVDCKTPVLTEIAILSFEKFKTENFNINYIIIENSDFNLNQHLENLRNYLGKDIQIEIFNNETISKFSHAHGEGLEYAKDKIKTEYVFTCHNDVCVTSQKFFNELEKLIKNKTDLAGVCEDSNTNRVKALHCSGLLCKTEIFKKISLLPELPKIDTADKLTLYVRENNLKEYLFKNTYNDKTLCSKINEPYRSLGENCGIDRCVNDDYEVIFMHQGRGTTKHQNNYHKPGKIMTQDWLLLCQKILNEAK